MKSMEFPNLTVKGRGIDGLYDLGHWQIHEGALP
jgi:hypothetical protein